MTRKRWIGLIIWCAFCLLVIMFSLVYIIIGQIKANATELRLIVLTISALLH